MNFEDLVEIVAKLRGPDGCPWDREQTRESLRQYLIEEFHEAVDAIDEGDAEGMKEEFGDLLFQIILQSQLSWEEGTFTIQDVVEGIARKMVSRHPHVFGDKDLKTSEEVKVWWEEHKRREGKVRSSAIGGVPRSLPALLRAQKIQRKATGIGFDWETIDDAFLKVEEELKELRDAVNRRRPDEIEDELGDLLFVLVRVANFFSIDPEAALGSTIKKFTKRFSYIEKEASRLGKNLADMTLAEMDALWVEAKKK
jgi:tetrapyrrole methylase family protein/MazG family protein